MSGPADHNRQVVILDDFVNGFIGFLLEQCQAPGFIRLSDIDQVMRNTHTLFESRFGSTNIHAPIEQPRISGDDFSIQFFCKLDGNLGFTDRSWSEDNNQWNFWIFRQILV